VSFKGWRARLKVRRKPTQPIALSSFKDKAQAQASQGFAYKIKRGAK
jgi:hypothetical protein